MAKKVEDTPTTTPNAVRTPSRRTLASMAEKQKAAAVVTAISEKYRSFICLACQMTFETYVELDPHKSQVHQKKLLSCITPKFRETQDTSVSGRPQDTSVSGSPEEAEGFGQDFMEFVSNAIDSVPEVTFNNMHGTVRHIDTT